MVLEADRMDLSICLLFAPCQADMSRHMGRVRVTCDYISASVWKVWTDLQASPCCLQGGESNMFYNFVNDSPMGVAGTTMSFSIVIAEDLCHFGVGCPFAVDKPVGRWHF